MTYITLLFFILLFHLLFPCNQEVSEILSLESLYPSSLTLNNGNILISGTNGLYIYELTNLNNLRNILNYDESHQISSEGKFIQTTFLQLPDEDGGYILFLNQGKIFVFYSNAAYKKDFDLSNEISGEYFSLNFYKKENKYIYYTLAYTDNHIFKLAYYKMNIEEEENINLIHKTHYSKDSSGNSQTQFDINIECEVMKSDELGKVLVCFHENRALKEIGNSLFLPDNNFEEVAIDNNIYISLGEYAHEVSAAVSKNLKKALICYILNEGTKLFCFFYNIDDYSHTTPKQYTNICGMSLQKFRVYYFQKINNFLLGCGATNLNFKFVMFNEENEVLINTEISNINDCYGYDTVSFAYFENISKFLIIADLNCQTGKKLRLYSIDNYIVSPKITTTILNTFITTIPTSIEAIIPTTIIKTIPTTIITTIPTTIITTIPTTITTTITSSIITTIPISINMALPTSIITTISSTYTTTIPTIISLNNSSTFTSITTSIPSKIITTFPNIITTIFTSKSSLDISSSVPYLNTYSTYNYVETSNLITSISSINDYNQYSTLPYYNSLESDKLSEFLDLIDFICPENKPLFKKVSNECVQFCSSKEILDKKCIINIISENNFEIINKNIRQIISNNSINENTDIIINGNNIIYQISTTDIAKDHQHENISKIDFGNCETKIKNNLKIDYIIIQKADIKINNITLVKYELYNPNKKDEKIDLSICNNEKIQIYTPISVDNEYIDNYYDLLQEGYNILNANDSFYNDICTPFTSNTSTDMILYDRKITYYNPNLTYCDNGCEYKNIEIKEKMIQCECPINPEENNEITYQQFSLADSFYRTNKYSNFKVVICYKLVFSEKGQTYNFGSYLLISIIFFYIISSLVYTSNTKNLVSNLILKILKSMNINNANTSLFYKANPIKKKYNQRININNNFLINISKNSSNINKSKNDSQYESTIKLSFKKKTKRNKRSKSLFSFNIKKTMNNKNNKNNNKNRNNKSNKNRNNKNKNNNILIYNNTINRYKYNDEELNIMKYEDALIYDERGYTEYYISLLNKKQLILFTFIAKTDYNLRVVKIALFLFSFSLYFTVNAFFFGDHTIHIIHENKGIFNILFQLPQILYTSAISIVCNLIFKSLALSEKYLINFKKNNKNFGNYNELINIYKCLKKKIIALFREVNIL